MYLDTYGVADSRKLSIPNNPVLQNLHISPELVASLPSQWSFPSSGAFISLAHPICHSSLRIFSSEVVNRVRLSRCRGQRNEVDLRPLPKLCKLSPAQSKAEPGWEGLQGLVNSHNSRCWRVINTCAGDRTDRFGVFSVCKRWI